MATYSAGQEFQKSGIGVEHQEGPVARGIEKRTARLPSDVFLWAALGSIAASLGLRFAGKKDESMWVGEWAPTFLMFGLYNKIVKVAGHDRYSH